MAKSTYDNIAKPVRKRSAATGTLVGVRLQDNELNAIDAWAKKQTPPITRPYAIRRLVEIGLSKPSISPPSRPLAKRAQELAEKTIERLVDPATPPEEKVVRRRRLVKGPSEFREDRVDQPRPKKR